MKRGDLVDEFELPDQTGTKRKFSDFLTDGPAVLFFYPAAGTPGCTAGGVPLPGPGKGIRRSGCVSRGISTDAVDKQAKFSDNHHFDFPVLSDADGTVASTFGVKRGLLGKFMPVKRTTFVIDTDRKVLEVISSEVNMNTHADKALEVLRAQGSG